MSLSRRTILAGGLGLAVTSALAQSPLPHRHGQFERLNQPGRIDIPDLHHEHAVTESPAPMAASSGSWEPRASLPIPRTEMAWAVAYKDRMHLVGGYAEQRVDRPYHHAYDPRADAWEELPQLPCGANHVGMAVVGDRLYALAASSSRTALPMTASSPSTGSAGTRCRACRRQAARSRA